MIDQKWTKQTIKAKLETDNRWVIRGLLAIYSRQTESEKCNGQTKEDNGIGFNGVDSTILSSFVQQWNDRNFLSPKQWVIVRKKIMKYAGQLAKIANGEA